MLRSCINTKRCFSCCSEGPVLQQQRMMQQYVQQLPRAPQLAANEQQQAFGLSCKQRQAQELAQVGEGRTHWLLQVLGIGVVNVLGLWAVLKVLQLSKDSEWPACRNSSCAARCEGASDDLHLWQWQLHLLVARPRAA
jgi:hypothetical protein